MSIPIDELRAFLTLARPQRLYPALYLAAHTGMRRDEIVGLNWSDLTIAHSRLELNLIWDTESRVAICS